MLVDDVADLAQLIGLGLAMELLDDHGLGYAWVFEDKMTSVAAVVDKAEHLQQGDQIGEGEIVKPLSGQHLRLELVGFVHGSECIE